MILPSVIGSFLLYFVCLSHSPVYALLQGLINYYCYEKYYNHVVNAAAGAQRTFSSDPIFSFFHAYGSLMQGKTIR